MPPSLRRIGAALGVAGALATKLGVSESKLGSAMQAARPTQGQTS